MKPLHFNECREDIICCSLHMQIDADSDDVFFAENLLPGTAFKAVCINKCDLTRGDDIDREGYAGIWCLGGGQVMIIGTDEFDPRMIFKSGQRRCSKFMKS